MEMMTVGISNCFGIPVKLASVNRDRTWEETQNLIRNLSDLRKDARLIRVSRTDGGAVYNAEGTFEIETDQGETFSVRLRGPFFCPDRES